MLMRIANLYEEEGDKSQAFQYMYEVCDLPFDLLESMTGNTHLPQSFSDTHCYPSNINVNAWILKLSSQLCNIRPLHYVQNGLFL